MVIKSINQLFGKNSRWIFGIFTVVIIISFMGFLTPGTFGGCGMGTAGEAGTGALCGALAANSRSAAGVGTGQYCSRHGL